MKGPTIRFLTRPRKNLRVVRSMPLLSQRLGLRGVADVVEFYQQASCIAGETCQIKERSGWWRPVPVEYKRGKPKPDDRDAVQLCAQAMALEEMLEVRIPEGFFFYAQIKRRESVAIDATLRTHTTELARRMHEFLQAGITPKAVKGKHCSQCSLVEECQPQWMLKHRSVANYIDSMCRMEGND